jgi:Protein of unknown function (DUF3710)
VIFSGRRKSGGRHARTGRHSRVGREAGAPDPDVDAPEMPDRGPYDISQAPTEGTRLDLGSLQIPALEGVDIRVQASPDGVIQQVILVQGDSALQLRVLAAPRSEGIWDEIREETRRSLYADGVATEEIDGEYGTELRARVPVEGGLTDLRLVGVDGPRWMVHGVYQGTAAADPAAAGPLADCLRGLVVDRGLEAKPVREPLPLRLPRELVEQSEPGSA